MPYSLYAADGSVIATGYFTDTEPDGLVAIWFGADLEDINREFIAWGDTQANADALIARLGTAGRLENSYAQVLWSVADVTDLLDVSDEQAQEFLEENGKHLRDRLVEEGYEIIKILYAESQGGEDEDEDDPTGKSCGNCGRELNRETGVDVEGRGWYCYNCASRWDEDEEDEDDNPDDPSGYGPDGERCTYCGLDLNPLTAELVEAKGWFCCNCAGRHAGS